MNVTVIYFDESSVSSNSFKRKIWQKKHNKKIACDFTFSSKSYNILLACTKDKLLNFWITEIKNQDIVISFLNETIDDYRLDDTQ